MSETIREEMARTPIDTHKYQGKRYLTLDGIDQILSYLKSQIEQIGNPYPKDIFPMDINGVGKLLGDKGLTDKEITAVSGCIARLGWLNCQQDILTNFSEEL